MKRLILLAVVASACGGPVDAEGTYTMSVTFRDNGCNIAGWTVGDSATNVHAVFIQSGDGLTANFMDISGVFLDGLTGAHTFGGKVDGNDLHLMLTGTKTRTVGNCTYTFDSNLNATLEGDVLTGRIDYIGNGNGQTDCAGIDGCVSFQDMNGTRPPT